MGHMMQQRREELADKNTTLFTETSGIPGAGG